MSGLRDTDRAAGTALTSQSFEEMREPLCDGSERSGAAKAGNVTRANRVGRPRYYVSEIEGFPIGPVLYRQSQPLLSCSVLDSYYNCHEVARFNEENVRPRTLSKRSKQRAVRARAAGLAAILNADA